MKFNKTFHIQLWRHWFVNLCDTIYNLKKKNVSSIFCIWCWSTFHWFDILIGIITSYLRFLFRGMRCNLDSIWFLNNLPWEGEVVLTNMVIGHFSHSCKLTVKVCRPLRLIWFYNNLSKNLRSLINFIACWIFNDWKQSFIIAKSSKY